MRRGGLIAVALVAGLAGCGGTKNAHPATLADAGAADAADSPGRCMTAADCPSTHPICTNYLCSSCATDAECQARGSGAPHCDVSRGTCVACEPLAGAESPYCANPATPICASDSTCRACQSHGECASQVCNLDGSCAAAAQIAYVDNRGGACTGNHAGTVNDPYCEIETAVMSGNKPLIRVFGSTTAYAAVTFSSGSFTVFGPDSGPSAIIQGSTTPAVSITGTATQVILGGLEITGTNAGISCSNSSLGPKLSVFRSRVHNLAQEGIRSNQCIVTLDRDSIDHNEFGIRLAASQYAITNCLIVGNGAQPTCGVIFEAGDSEIAGSPGFSHNTVAANSSITNGAISCAAGTPIFIRNSIVWGNSLGGTGSTASQIFGSCALEYVDIDDPTTPPGIGNRKLPPDFVDSMYPTYDFHLTSRTPANLACCVDQIPAPDPVDHDYDGHPRPAGARWDIGAQELP